MINVGWPSSRQQLTPKVNSWLPQGGDVCPSRMVVFPLRTEEFVLAAPFLPKSAQLEQLKQLGRFGWLVVYDEQQLAAARYLQRHEPIAAIIAPKQLSGRYDDCLSVGRFPNGYQLAIHSLHGSSDKGLAVVYRTIRQTTLFLSHVVQAQSSQRWRPTRRLTRSNDYQPDHFVDHLVQLGGGRPQLTVIFHGHRVWELSPQEWAERCREAVS
jgi:hypothetical protein